MPSLATNTSVIGLFRRMRRPAPTERVTSLFGATAPAGWAAALIGAVAARPAASAAARAVPSAARLMDLILIILACSHRNERDVVAAGDADHGASPRIRATSGGGPARSLRIIVIALGPAGHGAALETGHVGADRVGRVRVYRAVRDGEQQAMLGVRIVAFGNLDLAGGDRTLQLRIIVC